jgi:ketosteroid isomerase-like protein
VTQDEQKRIATELLYASESGNAEKVAQLVTDDFHFQFMERLDSWVDEGGKKSTRLNKQDFLKTGVPMVNDLTVDGMHFQVFLTMGEGPYVAIFGESNGTSKTGKKYNNRYCWRFTFTGDKVSEFLEFCDTHHAHQILFD